VGGRADSADRTNAPGKQDPNATRIGVWLGWKPTHPLSASQVPVRAVGDVLCDRTGREERSGLQGWGGKSWLGARLGLVLCLGVKRVKTHDETMLSYETAAARALLGILLSLGFCFVGCPCPCQW
jgi:hypothetical protein